MYLGQAMGICPGLMNFQTFDTFGTPYCNVPKQDRIRGTLFLMKSDFKSLKDK